MLRNFGLLVMAAMTGILGSVSPLPAHAAAVDYFDLPPEDLLNVEITSVSKRPEKLSDTAAAAYIITRDDILRSGVTTIPDALRLAPGVQVAQQDMNSWTISIRGFNNGLGNKLLVMIDGRTVYNPLFAGVYWEAQDVLLEDIDRIEIIRGPGGTLWGANAVNGVINIITRHSRETIGNLLTGAYGSHENPVVGFRHGGVLGPDQTWRVYAKAFERDHFVKPNGDPAPDEWESLRGGFRMDWNNHFTVQGDAYKTDAEHRHSIPVFTAPFSILEDTTVKFTGANLLARWMDEYADGSTLTVQSYIDYTGRDENLFLNDRRIILDAEAQYDFAQIGRHNIIAGAGYRYMTEDEGVTSIVTFTPVNQNDSIYNAFVQDKITLAPDSLYLTLGAKIEHNDFTGFEVQPNARLQWHPDDRQTLWGAVSRAVRTPTRLETSTQFRIINAAGPTQTTLIGNPDFKSEELTAYELGYRNQVTPDVTLDLAAFYNDYDNLATLDFGTPFIVNNGIDPVNTLIPVIFGNDMRGETYGFELAASWTVSPAWTLTGTYSFIDMFLHQKNPGALDNESGENIDPHHQAGLRSSWTVTDNLTLDASAWYVDQISQTDVGDYLRLDLNLGWQIDDNVKFNLVGQNLLEESHREQGSPASLGATEIERVFYGKFTWEF